MTVSFLYYGMLICRSEREPFSRYLSLSYDLIYLCAMLMMVWPKICPHLLPPRKLSSIKLISIIFSEELDEIISPANVVTHTRQKGRLTMYDEFTTHIYIGKSRSSYS